MCNILKLFAGTSIGMVIEVTSSVSKNSYNCTMPVLGTMWWSNTAGEISNNDYVFCSVGIG